MTEKSPTTHRRVVLRNDDDTKNQHDAPRKTLQSLLHQNCPIIVFSGAGISVSAGLPTFTGNLYTRAAKQFHLPDGSQVFRYRFLERRPKDYLAFFAGTLYKTIAKITSPTPSHYALHAMEQAGQLIRHYTLNVDGLASLCGMSIWKGSDKDDDDDNNINSDMNNQSNPTDAISNTQPSILSDSSCGKTVELHGNIHELVCRTCGSVYHMTPCLAKAAANGSFLKCTAVDCHGDLRFRVLLYGDQEGHLIHPPKRGDPWVKLLPHDLVACRAILWVGISFRQRASCQYFETVYQMRNAKGLEDKVPIFIIDPHPDKVLENLMDGLQMDIESDSYNVFTIESTSDAFFGEFCADDSKDSTQPTRGNTTRGSIQILTRDSIQIPTRGSIPTQD